MEKKSNGLMGCLILLGFFAAFLVFGIFLTLLDNLHQALDPKYKGEVQRKLAAERAAEEKEEAQRLAEQEAAETRQKAEKVENDKKYAESLAKTLYDGDTAITTENAVAVDSPESYKAVADTYAVGDKDGALEHVLAKRLTILAPKTKVLILDSKFVWGQGVKLLKCRVQSGESAHEVWWVREDHLKLVSRGEIYNSTH